MYRVGEFVGYPPGSATWTVEYRSGNSRDTSELSIEVLTLSYIGDDQGHVANYENSKSGET